MNQRPDFRIHKAESSTEGLLPQAGTVQERALPGAEYANTKPPSGGTPRSCVLRVVALAAAICCGSLQAANPPFRAGYFNSSWNAPPIQNINWPAWTYIFHFNAYPKLANGAVTLDTSELVNADVLISSAHSRGVRVLLTVLGTTEFVNTTDTSSHVSTLATLIGNFVKSHNYDGVDIDWETTVPLTNYTNFIRALRAQLDTYTPALGRSSDGKAIISGFFGPLGVAAANISNLDIVNISCYDNHSWDPSQWIVWHDAALRDPGDNGWSGGGYGCASLAAAAVQQGIPQAKIGAAMPFYVRDWIGGVDSSGEGAQRPGQRMLTAPTMGSMQSLNQLFNSPSLWQQQYMRRDVSAGNVPYLSVNQSGNGNDHFISYPDATSVANAWAFVTSGVGGVPLGGFTAFGMMQEYIPSGTTTAQQFPLSEALRAAAGSAPAGSAPSIMSASPLAGGSPGVAYSQTLQASGTNPITWSVISGALPAGLNLNATTGVISGTPTTGSTSTFGARATNTMGTNDKSFSITVVKDPYASWKLDDGAGTTLTDSSGNGLAASVTGNPAWMSGSSCVSGGCLSFNGSNQYGAASLNLSDTSVVTVAFWLNWNAYADNDKLAMEFGANFNNTTTGFMVDPNSSVGGGGKFEVGLQGDGGYNQVSFNRPAPGWHHYAFIFNKSAAADSEVVPFVDGVAVPYTKVSNAENSNTFSSGTLYLMSRAGSSLFGSGALDDIRIFKRALSNTEISGIAQHQSAPAITSSSTLTGGVVGTAYVQALAATGSTPISWAVDTGQLPPGLSLSTAGMISGTPTTAGVYTFSVRASNGVSPNATLSLSLTISKPADPPVITSPAALASATVGAAYRQTLSATGATPITWSITSGSLPPGLSLSQAGVISGTPSTAGKYSFTIRAQNGTQPDATQNATCTVLATVSQGPYSLWKLDDGTGSTAADSSGNQITARLFNNPTWKTGGNCALSQCLLFSGNQYGTAALDLSDTSVVSVAFWLNWTAYANDDKLAMEFSSDFNNVTTGFMVNPNSSAQGGGKFEAGFLGSAGYNQVLFARQAAGWHHYTIVFNKGSDAAHQVTPYVDGVAVAYTKPTSSANSGNFGSATLYFMSRGGASLFGSGSMDDVRVYKRALASSEAMGLAKKTLQ